MHKPIIIGNWKMQLKFSEASKLITDLRDSLFAFKSNVEIAVCPSHPHLFEVSKVKPDYIKLGAQDMYFEDKGAFTGAVSGVQLKELGCSYVILGHSERRHIFGEKNGEINKKIKAAFKNDLIPVVCVGEKEEERRKEKTEKIIKTQLESAIEDLSEEQIKKTIVAYEPVWAIGTGVAAKGEDALNVATLIKNIISSQFTKDIAEEVRVLYGGSVTPENAEEFVSLKEIDGVLGGGVSLKAEEFVKVIKITDSVKNK
jgi:triosephosphate isomerase